MSQERIYNYKFDKHDERDFKFVPTVSITDLPKLVDLSQFCPPIFDQSNLGSCTGNMTAGAIFTRRKIEKLSDIIPSRIWIYYQARKIEGTIDEDSGATIRDAIKGVATFGYCSEKSLPYDISKFTKTPSSKCVKEAKQNLIQRYESVPQDLNTIRACLAQNYSINIGIAVYESFESTNVAKTGIVPIPKPSEKVLGGHAVHIIGYDDDKKLFKLANSWGVSWGDKGFFYLPYDYVLNSVLASDFWRIILI